MASTILEPEQNTHFWSSMRIGQQRVATLLAIILLICSVATAAGTNGAKKPLNKEIILSLVVSGSEPESIVEHIHSRGIAFKPTTEFSQQLKTVGAGQTVLDAVTKAQVIAGDAQADDVAILSAMIQAGSALKAGDFTGAARALAATKGGARHPAVLFVMGELLSRQQAWPRAAALYAGLLEIDPDFPEVHTKLAYASYSSGSTDDAISEAKAALAETPRNPEAHKIYALVLQSDGQNEAALAEFQQALNIKPDYTSAHYDLGLLYEETQEFDSAIGEYRKAIALDATQAEYHHHLGVALSGKKEFTEAVTELREARRLDPTLVAARVDLAAALRNSGNVDAALAEYRELQKVVPASNFCHTCYGDLLSEKGDLATAAAEYREAQRLDTTDADAHLGLASVLDAQHSDEEALREYLVAEQLDPDSADIHRKVAHFYLPKHRLQDAIAELRDAVVALPTDEKLHYELADILASTGDNEAALAEYAAVVHLTPRWEEAATKFASLLEKQGQIQNALDEYHRIAQVAPGERTKTQYEQAALRLRPRQPAQPAQPLQAPEVAENRAVENSDLLWRASMDAVKAQLRRGNLTVAAYYSRQAVDFADSVTPHDARLTESLRLLGSIYQRLNKFPEARDRYLRALAVAQETWGNESEDSVLSLDALGDLAMSLKDYKGAEAYYSNAVDIARKLYVPGPARDAQLFYLASASMQEGHMVQAESLLQELISATKGHDPASESRLTTYVEGLANLYYSWGKYQQAEIYYRKTLSLQERQFSARSPMLDHTLYQLALVMGRLGRPKEEHAYLVRRMSILTAYNARYNR